MRIELKSKAEDEVLDYTVDFIDVVRAVTADSPPTSGSLAASPTVEVIMDGDGESPLSLAVESVSLEASPLDLTRMTLVRFFLVGGSKGDRYLLRLEGSDAEPVTPARRYVKEALVRIK